MCQVPGTSVRYHALIDLIFLGLLQEDHLGDIFENERNEESGDNYCMIYSHSYIDISY